LKLLLDTHVWLWAMVSPERLNQATRTAIADPTNEAWLSVASAWETAIKRALGKLALDPALLVDVSIQQLRIQVLPIALDHALEAASLPAHHRDPFDRMLVAQARLEGLTLVTADHLLQKYDQGVMWAG
jgi:PIN domain nuclease of toxin-antitoxin system